VASSSKKHRILIVDDHEDTREILRVLLEHHGYEVIQAESGEAAIRQLGELNPDLVILDISLPGMDGCETLERMRHAGHQHPVFLFSEQYDLFQDRIKQCRPDAFFPKSKGPLELVSSIARKLGTGATTA
jgi:CheY-like chemotaxis protein